MFIQPIFIYNTCRVPVKFSSVTFIISFRVGKSRDGVHADEI